MSIRPFVIQDENVNIETYENSDLGLIFGFAKANDMVVRTVADGNLNICFLVSGEKVRIFYINPFLAEGGEYTFPGKADLIFMVKLSLGQSATSNLSFGSLSEDFLACGFGISEDSFFTVSEEIMSETELCKKMKGLILEGASFAELCKEIEKAFSSKNVSSKKKKTGISTDIIEDIMERVCERDGNLIIAKMASDMGYSQKYLDRIFRARIGISIKKYAENIRMRKAVQMLERSETDNIFMELGFYDQAHFIKTFKRYTGQTPRQYKREFITAAQ